MPRADFNAHLNSTNLVGSKKSTSYLRALDLLQEMLAAHPLGFEDCIDLWQVGSSDRLHALRQRVRQEQQAGDKSVWNLKDVPQSYLQKGYCSAALTSYMEFLVEFQNAAAILKAFDSHHGDEAEVVAKLDLPLDLPNALFERLTEAEGKDVRRQVKTRVNQRAFRDIIFKIYHQRCCLTGIDIPDVNRASHIIGWAEDKSKRLDPRNGLCLSATYDAAFDRHLITLDDAYRLVLSRDLKEHYSSASFHRHFLAREGQRIDLPQAYLPEQSYLDHHRKQGHF